MHTRTAELHQLYDRVRIRQLHEKLLLPDDPRPRRVPRLCHRGLHRAGARLPPSLQVSNITP
jgi:hypothetical protein